MLQAFATVTVIVLVLASPALAQVGITNPNAPITVVPPGSPLAGQPNVFVKPDLKPGTPPRPSQPFRSDEPHQFNNPHPNTPNAGLGYALNRTWVPPQTVTITGYLPMPGSLSGFYVPQQVEIPGFYVTQTTTGVIYHSRWVLEQRNLGVYAWQLVPDTFVPR
jgi:hypothetical protein